MLLFLRNSWKFSPIWLMNQQHKMNFKKMKMITAIHMHRRLYMHVSMHPKMINNYLFTALVYNKARSNTGDKNLWTFYLYTFDIHIRLNRLYNCSFIFIMLVFPSGGAYLNKANIMFRWQNIYSGRCNTTLLKNIF